ncbi:hypothetical protein E4U54_007120 [Claviceps lovelessii]|nr:hypothetical protein E4U54_007120 [Claviceps lovelessii]
MHSAVLGGSSGAGRDSLWLPLADVGREGVQCAVYTVRPEAKSGMAAGGGEVRLAKMQRMKANHGG